MKVRTTVSLDPRLAEKVRKRAASQGLSVSAFIAATLADAIKRPMPSEAKPFRLITVGGRDPATGVALDRSASLEILDDEERWASRT